MTRRAMYHIISSIDRLLYRNWRDNSFWIILVVLRRALIKSPRSRALKTWAENDVVSKHRSIFRIKVEFRTRGSRFRRTRRAEISLETCQQLASPSPLPPSLCFPKRRETICTRAEKRNSLNHIPGGRVVRFSYFSLPLWQRLDGAETMVDSRVGLN